MILTEWLLDIGNEVLKKYPPKGSTTYCNFGVYDICKRFGFFFWNKDYNRPMLANEMIQALKGNTKWRNIDLDTAEKYLNKKGSEKETCLILAGEPKKIHGHVTILCPGKHISSGKWNREVPYCFNVGPKKYHGLVGLNYAFATIPDFYLYIGSFV